jgi:U3 small nucleolar RNA-associated protein 7
MRGKNSTMKRYLRKRSTNVIDERRMRLEAIEKREKEERERRIGDKMEKKLPPVLERFAKGG